MRTHTATAIIATLLCAASAQAARLTPAQALRRAASSDMTPAAVKSASSRAASPVLSYTMKDPDGNPTLYVFDRSDTNTDAGYIIVPADDAVRATVLGYADSGSFDPDNIPANMLWWLGQYSRQIQYTVENTAAQTLDVTAASSESRPEIEPILQTYWGQEEPYNDLCPVVNGVRCPSGCVATAMAQVMKHHNWPESATGSFSYKPYDVTETLSLQLDTVPLQWDKMLASYNSESAADARLAVARLMYAAGVAIHMEYTPYSSGGDYVTASKVLINNFGYSRSLHCINRNYYPLDQWTDIIYTELSQNRPVLYSGRNDEGGHAFVADGYRSGDYFHINWGWNGVSNGYFLVTALNPEVQGVGGSASGYNISQTIVVGMQPAPQDLDAEYVPAIEFMSGFTTPKNTYTRADGTEITFRDLHGIFNNSPGTVNITMGVRLTSKADGTVTYIPAEKTMKLLSGQAFVSYTVPASEFPQSGEYTVEPALLTSAGEWIAGCLVNLNHTRELNLTCSGSTLYFISEADAAITVTDLTAQSPLYPGKTYIISATLTAGDQEYLSKVTPVIIRDNTEITKGDPAEVDILPGQPQTITWVGEFSSSLATGPCEIALVDYANQIICQAVPDTIETAPAEEAEISVTTSFPGQGTLGHAESTPAEVSFSDFHALISVECTAGYFADDIFGQLYYAEHRGIRTVGGRYIGIKHGQTATVDLTDDMSDLELGHTYIILPWAKDAKQIADPIYFRSTTSGIETIEAPHTLAISPNPADSYIEISSDTPIASATIYSIAGTEVIHTRLPGTDTSATISVDPLPAGIYLLRAGMTDGTSVIGRLIIR